jgi:hypothetical protein
MGWVNEILLVLWLRLSTPTLPQSNYALQARLQAHWADNLEKDINQGETIYDRARTNSTLEQTAQSSDFFPTCPNIFADCHNCSDQ